MKRWKQWAVVKDTDINIPYQPNLYESFIQNETWTNLFAVKSTYQTNRVGDSVYYEYEIA